MIRCDTLLYVSNLAVQIEFSQPPIGDSSIFQWHTCYACTCPRYGRSFCQGRRQPTLLWCVSRCIHYNKSEDKQEDRHKRRPTCCNLSISWTWVKEPQSHLIWLAAMSLQTSNFFWSQSKTCHPLFWKIDRGNQLGLGGACCIPTICRSLEPPIAARARRCHGDLIPMVRTLWDMCCSASNKHHFWHRLWSQMSHTWPLAFWCFLDLSRFLTSKLWSETNYGKVMIQFFSWIFLTPADFHPWILIGWATPMWTQMAVDHLARKSTVKWCAVVMPRLSFPEYVPRSWSKSKKCC